VPADEIEFSGSGRNRAAAAACRGDSLSADSRFDITSGVETICRAANRELGMATAVRHDFVVEPRALTPHLGDLRIDPGPVIE